ncbi:hypothetical protein [Thermomonospora umbrina]|uniref:Uncharacterized protein n=1 Tax=Thermomonospora umbrina TaxID=111806 RepID=A0A3D9T0W8_9ACTN|nr:hypothetical protein [Thermomonospora umbrina]REF00461.1 hypothetical protein DFJ69_5999 [Thermomonospora umbrina]
MFRLLLGPFVIVVVVTDAWLFMVTVGVIRGEWLPALPTIDFPSAVLVSVLMSVWLAALTGSTTAMRRR